MATGSASSLSCFSFPDRARDFLAWACPLFILATLAVPVEATASSRRVQIPLIIQKGTPLRVRLLNRVPIKRAGVEVNGQLVSPVYVFNRQVLVPGCELQGRVTKVQGVSRRVRIGAIMGGNFTPLRTAQVEFDTLILKNGKRVPIATSVSTGELAVVHLESGASRKTARQDPISAEIVRARRQMKAEENQVLAQVKGPGKMHRLRLWLKSRIVAWLPYHRQAYLPGTVFTARLEKPVRLGSETLASQDLTEVGAAPPPDSVVHARLLTALNSATARRGAAVSAIITQPLFSAKHLLIIPEGSVLKGAVVDAKPARTFHRNGKLRFTFQRLVPPAAVRAQAVHASVQGLTVAGGSHLRLDAEGGVSPVESKKRFIAPAISVALAAWVSTPDRDAVNSPTATVPGQGGGLGQVLGGGGGFGLFGSVLALASRSYVVSGVLGFYGAAWSVYSHLLARGQNVAFPADTPMEIRFGTHHHPVRELKPAPGSSSHTG